MADITLRTAGFDAFPDVGAANGTVPAARSRRGWCTDPAPVSGSR